MHTHEWNKAAWNHAIDEGGNPYTTVVSPEDVAAARQGSWSLYLSDCKPVPRDWFPSLHGLKVLYLASGGGQQAPTADQSDSRNESDSTSGAAPMNDYLDTNQQLWNAWTPLHETSDFYDLPGFKAGKSSLRAIERTELTDVAGRSLLHLQCHFGLDTLSWARKGALVTGVDFSDQSIALAQSLSTELGIPATFVCSDVEHLPEVLSGQFEIVFSSYGVLPWLRDLRRWAEVIAHFLAPGGIFYLVDDHPLMRTLRTNAAGELTVANPYFFSEEPSRIEARGSYAAPGDDQTPLRAWYIWNHSLGEILGVLLGAGLHIEFLHEFPFAMRAKFAGMQRSDDGTWRFSKPPEFPLLFSLQARKLEGTHA